MFEWTQERTLVITNNCIYNIHKKSVKRCIKIESVGALIKCQPPSKCTTEFTVHVPKHYDYRFVSDK